MTWTIETSQGYESDKIASLCVPYLQGKFLDLGCGNRTVWPTAIGVDNGGTFGPGTTGIRGDISDLSMFKDETMDGVFSSHALEDFPREQVPEILREWARVLKVGGHMVLYVPSANLYPVIGQHGANPHHKWNIYPGDIEAILKELALKGSKNQRLAWTLLESEERGGTNEYSLFIVVRKEKAGAGWKEDVWQRNPGGRKRALVCRFGAIGDQIVASSILPLLQRQGYHVTYMTTPDAANILKYDPNIDAWWTQATDYVPNQQLGPYWASVSERFDKFINLSESVEGALLALPGRLQHEYPQEARRRIMGHVNYYERTHDIADVPYEIAPRFYASATETTLAWAKKARMTGGPVILWAIHGSSCHKIYPWVHVVGAWLMEKVKAHLVITGDPVQGKQLQDGLRQAIERTGADMSRFHGMAGAWDIREALTFAQVADCVVGPETGLLNGVAMTDNPKVIMLSHSSRENLTKYWQNTVAVTPAAERCPCYPCHRLHYGWAHCVQNAETQAAQCASSIAPETLFDVIMTQLGFQKMKEAGRGLDEPSRVKEHAGSDCQVDQ